MSLLLGEPLVKASERSPAGELNAGARMADAVHGYELVEAINSTNDKRTRKARSRP